MTAVLLAADLVGLVAGIYVGARFVGPWIGRKLWGPR